MKREQQPLPSNLEAERVIFGSILLDNRAFEQCASLVAEDFYLMAHQRLFLWIQAALRRGDPVDSVTLQDAYLQEPELKAIGAAAYIADLTTGLPRRLRCDRYVEIVKEKARNRRLLAALVTAEEKCWKQQEAALEIGRAVGREMKAIFNGAAK